VVTRLTRHVESDLRDICQAVGLKPGEEPAVLEEHQVAVSYWGCAAKDIVQRVVGGADVDGPLGVDVHPVGGGCGGLASSLRDRLHRAAGRVPYLAIRRNGAIPT
jgi:hypothetical protein